MGSFREPASHTLEGQRQTAASSCARKNKPQEVCCDWPRGARMARGQRVICVMIGLPTVCTGDCYVDWPGYPIYKGAREPGRGERAHLGERECTSERESAPRRELTCSRCCGCCAAAHWLLRGLCTPAARWFCCVFSTIKVPQRQRVSGFDLLAKGP